MQFIKLISTRHLNLPLVLRGLCIILLLNGCATNNRVSQDFKPGTDFSAVKTFAWHNVSSQVTNIDNVSIQRTIERELTLQGLQLVSSNPDVVLDLNIISQKSTASKTGLGLSLGLPIGNSGSLGLGTSKLLGQDNKQEGLIILDITKQASSQVIWRGTAEAVPLTYFTLRNEAQLNKVLQNLLAQFPPKDTK